MFFHNLLKHLCLNETIFINSTANSTIFQTYLVNDCFLQLILLIPVFTIFLIVNAYQYGFNKQISRHITSIQLIFYRLLTSLLIISLLIKFILKYFIFNIDYEISSVVLINDLFQIISILFHLNLLFNKQIFKNLNFQKYPISLLIVLILLFLANLINFLNQLVKHVYLIQQYNKLDLTNFTINGFLSSILLIYIISILIFYKLNIRNQSNFNNLASEEDKANYISYITLGWLKNVLKKGYKRKLNSIDDLSQLPYDLNINDICKRFMSKYTDHDIEENPIINPDILTQHHSQQDDIQIQYRPDHVSKRTLISALVRCFGGKFLVLGFIKLLNDCLNFSGPLLLNRLVQYIEINSQDLKLGCMYATALFFTALIASFLNIHFTYALNKLCLKIKCALIGLIYTKTVQIQLNELNNYSIGQIVNFMSIDR
jgi:ATP-binding cassette subfamily C (CFTR/MRP) protein 10